MTLSDLCDQDFKVTTFFEVEYRERQKTKDKITIAQEVKYLKIWNGTMFVDLQWPLNASRSFVSINWASTRHRKRGICYSNVAGWVAVCHSRYCV